MKSWFVVVAVLVAGTVVWGQQKRPPAAPASASRMCEQAYANGQVTQGWPETPVLILFHRDKSKGPWTRNPALKLPGLEAATLSQARTVLCVDETLLEAGTYDSGEKGYSPDWSVTLVRVADGKVYFASPSFHGGDPPGMKFHGGAGIGRAPVEAVTGWLRLVLEQKVARLKIRMQVKDHEEISALAFSADDRRLVAGEDPRSTFNGTPPAGITVFDLATGQAVASLQQDQSIRAVAISKTGEWVATEHYGHPRIWEVSSGKIAKELGTYGEPQAFAADDTLGVADRNEVSLWDIHSGQRLGSAAGTSLLLSPSGAWLAVGKGPSGVTLQEMASGRTLASFPPVGDPEKIALSGDGKALVATATSGVILYVAGSAQPHVLHLPDRGFSLVHALAGGPEGIAFANSDGYVGVVSAADPEPRVFATEYTGIRSLAVSPDGKLLALGDGYGSVSVFELR